MDKQHILVVDDESGVRDVLKAYLEREGFSVSVAATGPDALKAVAAARATLSLIVLDIMLPGLDGLSLLRRIREEDAVPVILLSARTDEFDRVYGLELGADDYVAKPFSPREVVSRVKAVLRRGRAIAADSPGDRPLMSGDIALDPKTRIVTVGGAIKDLTAKEFDLLWFLMRHPRQVFSREQLLDQVWGFSEFIDLSTVTVHMHRLREKIEAEPAKPRRLLTVWGVGYRFAGDE